MSSAPTLQKVTRTALTPRIGVAKSEIQAGSRMLDIDIETLTSLIEPVQSSTTGVQVVEEC